MTRQLCAGLPAGWWTPDDDGARLAQAICRRCPAQPGCLDGDPQPHGVIRAGRAYSDAGKVLPDCEVCGRPCADYRGGTPRCRVCTVPDMALPDVSESRVRWLLALRDRGFTLKQVGAEAGLAPNSVSSTCARYRQRAAIPAPALSFTTHPTQRKAA